MLTIEDIVKMKPDDNDETPIQFESALEGQEAFKLLVATYIKRDGIDELMEWLDSTDFYTAPASMRYHGAAPGGLCRHSMAVALDLIDELRFIGGQETLDDITLESAMIVGLFHDLCKIGVYGFGVRNVKVFETEVAPDGTFREIDSGKQVPKMRSHWEEKISYTWNDGTQELGHAPRSMFLIQNHMKLTDAEAEAIYWHMGAYDLLPNSVESAGMSKCCRTNMLAFCTQRADAKAAMVDRL